MRNNFIVVKEAVKNNGLALKFASPLLQENPCIALAAINNDHKAMQHVSPRIRSMDNDELITFMQTLGYISCSRGMCNGLAMMAIQAILCDDFDTYEFRLQKLILLRHQYHQLVSQRQELLELIKKDSDILAFLDGVELYQQPQEYPYLFPPMTSQLNAAQNVEPILRPLNLEARQGMARLEVFLRIYTCNELALHLKKTKNYVSTRNPLCYCFGGQRPHINHYIRCKNIFLDLHK